MDQQFIVEMMPLRKLSVDSDTVRPYMRITTKSGAFYTGYAEGIVSKHSDPWADANGDIQGPLHVIAVGVDMAQRGNVYLSLVLIESIEPLPFDDGE